MAFDINQFRSSFHNYEPASPANYEVIIAKEPLKIIYTQNPNEVVANKSFTDMPQQLAYRCESCSMPSRDLIASNRITYGAPKKVASGSVFNNVTFSFIVSDDMSEKNYFYQWQNSIINNTAIEENNTSINDVSYYNEYTGTIMINTFSKFGDLKYAIILEDAYPISVQEVQLGWNNSNDYVRVNVTMAYRYFYESMENEKGINSKINSNITSTGANRVNLNKSRIKAPFLQ